MLERGVRGENGVVRLNNGVRHRRRGVHAELQLRLLAVVGGEALKDESTKPRAGSTAKRVEHKEALETIAVVGQTANLVHDEVDLLLANGVVATGVCGTRQTKAFTRATCATHSC